MITDKSDCNFKYGIELSINEKDPKIHEELSARKKEFDKCYKDFGLGNALSLMIRITAEIGLGRLAAMKVGLIDKNRECKDLPERCISCTANPQCYILDGIYIKTPLG